MEVVEIIIYIGVAVVLGALVVLFIARWDAKGTYEGIGDVLRGDDGSSQLRVSSREFPGVVLSVWEECGLGTMGLNRTVVVVDDAPVNKTQIFAFVKAAALCKSLQSTEHDCGSREDVVFDGARGSAVLRFECDPSSRALYISS